MSKLYTRRFLLQRFDLSRLAPRLGRSRSRVGILELLRSIRQLVSGKSQKRKRVSCSRMSEGSLPNKLATTGPTSLSHAHNTSALHDCELTPESWPALSQNSSVLGGSHHENTCAVSVLLSLRILENYLAHLWPLQVCSPQPLCVFAGNSRTWTCRQLLQGLELLSPPAGIREEAH